MYKNDPRSESYHPEFLSCRSRRTLLSDAQPRATRRSGHRAGVHHAVARRCSRHDLFLTPSFFFSSAECHGVCSACLPAPPSPDHERFASASAPGCALGLVLSAVHVRGAYLHLAAEAPASVAPAIVAPAIVGLLLGAGADMGRRRKRRRVGAPLRGERRA